jgi:hypothetical protein
MPFRSRTPSCQRRSGPLGAAAATAEGQGSDASAASLRHAGHRHALSQDFRILTAVGPAMGFDPAGTATLAMATPRTVDLVDVKNGQVTPVPNTEGASQIAPAPDGALGVVVKGDILLVPHPPTDPARSRLVVRTGEADDVTFSPAGAMAVAALYPAELAVYPPGNSQHPPWSQGARLTPVPEREDPRSERKEACSARTGGSRR